MVGWPTVLAIVGNNIAPRLADWYLSRQGYRAQQTQEPEEPDRSHNLWLPADEERDFGAHGRFGAYARKVSWQLQLTKNRSYMAAAGLFVAGVIAACRARRANQQAV
jgi:hypothetical protein